MKVVNNLESSGYLQNRLKPDQAPVILYFLTPECSVCLSVYPQLMSLLEEDDIEVIKIDASEFPEVAGQHLVFTAPTILVFFEGNEVLRESRFIDFRRIRRLLDLMN